MSEDGGFRRLTPPPRRTAGPIDVIVRWRVELLTLAVGAVIWWQIGWLGITLLVAGIAALVGVSPMVRRQVNGHVLAVVAMHRVRVGLVQAGVADRAGRLPWLVHARPGSEEKVIIRVWLRAGTTIGDLRIAAPIISAACGARSVSVDRLSTRSDHARLVIDRPRWPLPPV